MNLYILFCTYAGNPVHYPIYHIHKIIESTDYDLSSGKHDNELGEWRSNSLHMPGQYIIVFVERHADLSFIEKEAGN